MLGSFKRAGCLHAAGRFGPGKTQLVGLRRSSPVHQRSSVLRVTAVEDQTAFQLSPVGAQDPLAVPAPPAPPAIFNVDPALAEEYELEELDEAQEQLLKWMLYTDEDAQEADLDEMADYENLGTEEYEDLVEEMEELIDQFDYEFKLGDRVLGTVMEVDEDGAYVEIGAKATAYVPLHECSFAKLKSPLEVLRPGMKREFLVVEEEDRYTGQITLSLASFEASVFWQRLRQLQDEGLPVTVMVESANKGGLLVKYGMYDGFVPVSQLGFDMSIEDMEARVGQPLLVKILELNEETERLVFSSRLASGQAPGEAQGFKVGDVVLGTVQSIKPYGAFIDLNGTTGLLHVSQISHDRIMNVETILSEGDKLKVMILSLDKERGRMTLTTKKLEATPGDMLKDPQLVFDNAEKMANVFRERMEQVHAGIVAPTSSMDGFDGGFPTDEAGAFATYATADPATYGQPPAAGTASSADQFSF